MYNGELNVAQKCKAQALLALGVTGGRNLIGAGQFLGPNPAVCAILRLAEFAPDRFAKARKLHRTINVQ
jgi:hypothetical protein